MMRLRQIYCLGWALVLAALLVGGHAEISRHFVGSAFLVWIVYSLPFGITFMIAKGSKSPHP
jgi:hypothetical protein